MSQRSRGDELEIVLLLTFARRDPVTGTLEGFTFGSDDEGERPAGAGTGKVTTASKDDLEGSEDDGKPKKMKPSAKGPVCTCLLAWV